MGQKVWFATKNNDLEGWNNLSASYKQYKYQNDVNNYIKESSCFSGFTVPVFYGKKWTGQFDAPISSYGRKQIEPGWLEAGPTYPDVVVPENKIRSGVVLDKTFRPLIFDGGPYIGPFSRVDATRLWWTMKKVGIKEFSVSGQSNSTYNEPPPDEFWNGCMLQPNRSSSINASVLNVEDSQDSDVEATETESKILGTKQFCYTASNQPQQSDGAIDDCQVVLEDENNIPNGHACPNGNPDSVWFYWDCGGSESVASNSINLSFSNEVICDIDNPDDFYLKARVNGSVSVSSEAHGIATVSAAFSTSSYYIIDSYEFNGELNSYRDFIDLSIPNFSGAIYGNSFEACNECPQIIQSGETCHFGDYYFQIPDVQEGCICDLSPYWQDGMQLGCNSYYVAPVIKTIPFHFFDGKIINIKVAMYNDKKEMHEIWGGGGGTASASSSLSEPVISFKVTKYFEYGDGNENPIYDKDTGSILRDPVTGEPV